MITFRRLWSGVVVGAVLAFTAAAARAQGFGAGAPMPLGVDLAKVPTGTWGEYAMTVGPLPPMKSRFALVGKAKTKTGNEETLEMSVEGGMMAMTGDKMVVQTTVESAKGQATVKKIVTQIGANPPMEMPSQAVDQAQFTKPDPKALVGAETLKVPGGTFKTKHYRDKSPTGGQIDYWLSDTAPPLGLVKMEADQQSVPGLPGPMKLELSAVGKGAKPVVVKAPEPYDENKLRSEAMAGAKMGAPPPAAPAPAPGKK